MHVLVGHRLDWDGVDSIGSDWNGLGWVGIFRELYGSDWVGWGFSGNLMNWIGLGGMTVVPI